MAVDENDQIIEFQEKPKQPKSNLASMGVYVFTWKTLKKYLLRDDKNEKSDHDFGKNIIPTMLKDKRVLQAYRFSGYWRDVGTLTSLHEANMDVCLNRSKLDLFDRDPLLRIYSKDVLNVPQYIGKNASIKNSIAATGAIILGSVDSCVISSGVIIENHASCKKAVIMENCIIKKGAKIENAIIAPNSIIEENEHINLHKKEIVLVNKR